MSRVEKCDVCRLRKIKCDNQIPVCGPCKIKGRPCRYGGPQSLDSSEEGGRQLMKQDRVNQGGLQFLGTSNKGGASIQTWRLANSTQLPLRAKSEPSRPLTSQSLQLAHRWSHMIWQDSPFEIFGTILRSVPVRIGSHPALDAAIWSFIYGQKAFVTRDWLDINNARRAYAKAYNSLRKALPATSLKDEDAILVTIALRMVADATFSSDANFRLEHETLPTDCLHAMESLPHHVHMNTICQLLKDRWTNSRASGIDKLVVYGEISSAIGNGKASVLDDEQRLKAWQRLGLEHESPLEAAFDSVMNQLIKLPQVISFVRQCITHQNERSHAESVLSLITDMYEFRMEPLPIDVAESSDIKAKHGTIAKAGLGQPIFFASVSDFILAINYFTYRSICCGLMQRLYSANVSSEYAKIATIWAEEIEIAEIIARISDYALMAGHATGSRCFYHLRRLGQAGETSRH